VHWIFLEGKKRKEKQRKGKKSDGTIEIINCKGFWELELCSLQAKSLTRSA
jgi:hypothetical protein